MDSQYQKDLYNNLMNLVASSEAFYYTDVEYANSIYRIFNYRLASYTDFLRPGALECCGTMFELEDGKAFRLAALPMEKFFNYKENSMVMDVDFSQTKRIMEKKDGYLVSSYLNINSNSSIVRLKSKGSLESKQCTKAMIWLNDKDNDELRSHIYKLTRAGYTVNMEWCAPYNRIAIGYEEPHLTILNVRNNVDGEYIYKENSLVSSCNAFMNAWVDEIKDITNVDDFVFTIPHLENIEGYVIELNDSKKVKLKTNWYLTRHKVKDSVNSPRKRYEAVIDEATDDMRSLFFDDNVALTLIDEMEKKVYTIYNHHVDMVERFYERNKHLSRKDYAILGQNELPQYAFSLAMSKYLGKDVDYKAWMKKHWKTFGIKDDE